MSDMAPTTPMMVLRLESGERVDGAIISRLRAGAGADAPLEGGAVVFTVLSTVAVGGGGLSGPGTAGAIVAGSGAPVAAATFKASMKAF